MEVVMGRMRDSQKSRVYRSDHVLDKYGRLETIPEIEVFVRKLWSSERLKKAFGPKGMYSWVPKIRDGRGRVKAAGNASGIWLPLWSRSKGIIIHELAHTLSHRVYGSRNIAGHGWEFCDCYLTLTKIALGRPAHDELKRAFKENKVKYKKPRKKKPLTPEQRAALVERMAKARASRGLSNPAM
jgi:hypothetical protein